jgi:transcriptional regulator GlxA family with amidase domain
MDKAAAEIAMAVQTDILVIKGAMASSVAITLDVLSLANAKCRGAGRPPVFDVRIIGAGADDFRPFAPAALASEPGDARARLLIVPAQGLSKADSLSERLAEDDAEDARLRIHAATAAGAQVASSCTGTLLLASTHLLDGMRATTAWWLAPAFRQMFPEVRLDERELIVTDGTFTTAGAAMAQMDVMVGLVARYAGATVAEQCAKTMILDERRSQTPYMAVGLLSASDEGVSRAAEWARARLEDGIDVNDLASAAGLSPRTFARRVNRVTGLSPVRFLQRLRAERAIELVETTRLPFDEIARRVGYAEPSTLRQLVRSTSGVGPRELRMRTRPLIARS